MATKKHGPEIRFQGFSEEWEEKGFSKLFAIISNNILSRAELNYSYGNAKNIHYGDVLIKFGELLDAQKEILPYINDDAVVEKLRASKLQNGDVIIADAAEDEIVGKCTELINIGDQVIFSGLHTIACRPTTPFATGFLGYAINSSAYHDQLLSLMQGTKVLSISKSSLNDTAVRYPVELQEQSKIGRFLQNLDAQITLHQGKLSKLGAVKKAMLEKMFPREGAALPEIRFKGFAGEWEKKTLGEIVTEIRRPIELKDEQVYELVTVKRRNEGVVSRCELKGKQILVKNYFELRTGDYIISKRQIVHGANGLVPPQLDRAIVSNEYLVAIGNDQITTEYFALFSKRPEMYRIFFLSSYGIDIEKLVFDVADWKKRFVVIPKLAEQQKIVSFFTHLDFLIGLQQRELDKLKNIKHACLEKMFV